METFAKRTTYIIGNVDELDVLKDFFAQPMKGDTKRLNSA